MWLGDHGRDVRSQGAGEVEDDCYDGASDKQALGGFGRQAGVGGDEGERGPDHTQKGQQEGRQGSAEYLLERLVVPFVPMLFLQSQKGMVKCSADCGRRH